MYFQKPWCIRSGPISTIAKSSHGFVASRWSASCEAPVGHLVHLPQEVVLVLGAEVLAVEQVLADDLLDLAPEDRRVRVLAAPVDGVRKHETMTPLSGRGGNVPGHAEDDRATCPARVA